jgi:imidazolonepropionase
MDIHKIGGGINFTVKHTREASEDALLKSLLKRMRRMLRAGCTLMEAKSGYGLCFAQELKMLRVLQRAHELQPIDVVLNFCGAHSVPQGEDAEAYAQDIIEVQLPELQAMRERKELDVALVDVFCEKGVFSTPVSQRILDKAHACGFKTNFHGDELNYTASAEMGAEVGALAISHLEHVSEKGIELMAEKKVVAVLLPSTAYVLRIAPPPARALIDGGVPVALGTDFNPNAHCMSLPFIMNLACVTMKMTMNEALVAATLNAAASVDKADDYGSLETGKWGDFLVLDAERWEHLIYELVDPPIAQVYKRGKLVFENKENY